MATKPKLTFDTNFNTEFGWFHNIWAMTEGLLDCAIGKFLRLDHSEAHILTAGMEHGRKATLLRGLVSRSDHRNKSELLRTLNVIQNESLRNVFAHSYIASSDKVITFVERSRGGPYWAKEHNFTMKEFEDHVTIFVNASRDFESALELESLELHTFLLAALSAKSKA